MSYTIKRGCTADEIVVRDADGEFVYPSKTDLWAEYETWRKAGNTPNPAPVETPPPEPTLYEKLARLGLTDSELDTLFGPAKVAEAKRPFHAEPTAASGA